MSFAFRFSFIVFFLFFTFILHGQKNPQREVSSLVVKEFNLSTYGNYGHGSKF